MDKAFAELVEIGLVDAGRRLAGLRRAVGRLQPDRRPRCTPGADEIVPVKPTGIAKSLNIGDPAAGLYALEAVRRTGGWMEYADDDEIRDGIALLARTTGVFAETAGGVTVAVLRKLVAAGALDPAAETVVFNTGEGLKTLDAVAARHTPTVTLKPSLRAARDAGLLD